MNNMEQALNNAYDGLRRAKAILVPSKEEVEHAPNGSRWHGRKQNGDRWMLIKHNTESYQVEC